MPYGDPPRCRCGQYHMVETHNAVVTVPCPFGWDSVPMQPITTAPAFHCPGCRCNERDDTEGE